jgi:hypothetical protein
MTRKDYIVIASAVAKAATNADSTGSTVTRSAITCVAYRLADILAADNPRFDLERFLEACRLD